MRLLQIDEGGRIKLTKDFAENDIPRPYAILSHTWGPDSEEVLYRDLQKGRALDKPGHIKLHFCASQAMKDGINYFWIDSCCIDRTNSVELARAINSMFRWYERAKKCYVYLADVPWSGSHSGSGYFDESSNWEADFRDSRWFRRGWTLQELLAPDIVEFFSSSGERLGDRSSLEKKICEITHIPVRALRGQPFSTFTKEERFRWQDLRQTKEEEDLVYSLLGIFDVSMAIIYGEGKERARRRLENEIENASKGTHRENFSVSFSLADNIETPHFVARTQELQKMRTSLASDGTRRAVTLYGPCGIGKTQLAIAYAVRYKDNYSAIFWLDMRDEISLKLSFARIARQIVRQHPLATGLDMAQNPKLDDPVEAVKEWLSLPNNTRWLLIYDNYDNPSTPNSKDNMGAMNIHMFLPQSYQGSIIVATRSPQVDLGIGIHVQKLDRIDDSLEILSQASRRGAREELSKDPNALALVKHLDGMPLALATAGVDLRRSSLSFAEYLHLHKTSRAQSQETSPSNVLYEDRASSSAEQLSFDYHQLETSVSGSSSDSGDSHDLSLSPLNLKEGSTSTWSSTSTLLEDHNDCRKIIVGVDFGTTYTGVSYVFTTGDPLETLEDVQCISHWPGPGGESHSQWKTPSRIAYGTENGSDQNAWGYGVTPGMRAHTWMKLYVDGEQTARSNDPSQILDEDEGVLNDLGLPPDRFAPDVSADFLKEIVIFAYDTLKRRVPPEVLSVSPLEFCFTVPAQWSDKEITDTSRAGRKAVESANLSLPAGSSITLIKELEAAAIAAFSSLTEGGSRQQIKDDDCFVLCDAGGGTVDVMTYIMQSTQPLQFREYLVGTSGRCGSMYIDRQFLAWMESQFGTAFTSLPQEKRGPASRFMKEFERHKRDFGTSMTGNKEYEITLPMKGIRESKYYNTDDQVVILYDDDMKQLFDSVVASIVALLESQLQQDVDYSGCKTIKTIFLVGGFGDSLYLYKVLREWCERQGGIRLICQEYPQAAIVRGAALGGLHSLRLRARRHYGFGLFPRFNQRRHDRKYLYIDGFDGVARAHGYIDWLVRKGDRITEETEQSIHCVRTLLLGKPLKYKMWIYKSDLDSAPMRAEEEGVQKLATIPVDLSNFDLSRCRTKTKNGKLLLRLRFELQVKFRPKRSDLYFRYLVDGRVAGSTSVPLDGEGDEQR